MKAIDNQAIWFPNSNRKWVVWWELSEMRPHPKRVIFATTTSCRIYLHVVHFQVLECSVARRLTMLLLASLRASGTVRLYVETASVRER